MMRRAALPLAATAIVALVVSSCSSSGGAKQSTSASQSSSPSTPVSTSPTPPPPSTSSTPKPSPTPLSTFENDPAVQVLRKWEAEGARVVNSGHYTSTALRALETTTLAKQDKVVWGPDVGSYYPGPAPYQPLGVTANNATTRTVHGCAILNGWAQDRTTHKPKHGLQVAGVQAQTMRVNGSWRMNAFYIDKHLACKSVKVKTQRW